MDPNSSQGKPRRRRRRKRKSHSSTSAQSGTTTIASLSNDNIADILLCLPSPASLGRAALTCPRWLRLATSPDFLRRFRALHPRPPLLGCFIRYARLPVFHRVLDLSDRDLAAAARGGDFLLTSFVDGYEWSLKDGRDGLFLLASDDELALFDPVSRRRVRIPLAPRDVDSGTESVHCLLPSCVGNAGDDDASSFRVLSLEYDSGFPLFVRPHVYSCRTGEWRTHQLALPPHRGDLDFSSSTAMYAAGRVYWKQDGCSVLLSLNTETIEFSCVELPPVLVFYRATNSYAVGDTDGACCLVCAPIDHRDPLRVWLRNEEKGSWELWWELQNRDLLRCIGNCPSNRYRVTAVVGRRRCCASRLLRA